MVSRSVRLIGALVVLITFSVNVHGKSLTFGDDSPYEYFLQNPSEADRFIQQIMADDELSDIQKEAPLFNESMKNIINYKSIYLLPRPYLRTLDNSAAFTQRL